MADITMMRGYGFPRGGQMDYAGYRGFNGVLVNSMPRRYGYAASIPMVPEPNVFEKIPPLDGFGTDYVFRREHPGYGDMVLPTLDTETGEWLPAERPSNVGKVLGLAAVGVGLWWLFGR